MASCHPPPYSDALPFCPAHYPTDFRFLPDGRMLIVEKGGAIKVASSNGQVRSTPLITLPTTSTNSRGLHAIALDPNYLTNGYVYVAYIPADNIQQLSRLTVTNPTASVLTIDPASQVVLVKGIATAGNDHMGGGLSFGPDGKLYWSTGDNVCCSVIDGSNSQNLTNMYGKVLRLNPDGTAPTENPFYDGAGPHYGRHLRHGIPQPVPADVYAGRQTVGGRGGPGHLGRDRPRDGRGQLRLAERRRPLRRYEAHPAVQHRRRIPTRSTPTSIPGCPAIRSGL